MSFDQYEVFQVPPPRCCICGLNLLKQLYLLLLRASISITTFRELRWYQKLDKITISANHVHENNKLPTCNPRSTSPCLRIHKPHLIHNRLSYFKSDEVRRAKTSLTGSISDRPKFVDDGDNDELLSAIEAYRSNNSLYRRCCL